MNLLSQILHIKHLLYTGHLVVTRRRPHSARGERSLVALKRRGSPTKEGSEPDAVPSSVAAKAKVAQDRGS